MIDGVKVVPLRQIVDERGKIMHMLKATDDAFHRLRRDLLLVRLAGNDQGLAHPHDDDRQQRRRLGQAKLVLYDLRDDSPTKGELQEMFFGEDNYVLVQIPPGIANGYKAYGDKLVIMANAAPSRTGPKRCCGIDPFTRRDPIRLGIAAWLEVTHAADRRMIATRTPLRVSFVGGGTDLPEFYEREAAPFSPPRSTTTSGSRSRGTASCSSSRSG